MLTYEVANSIRKKYGSAFYIFDKASFLHHYNVWKKAFVNIYENMAISYSYKTNYLPVICALNNKMGGYAEVVSETEFEIAKRINVPLNKIIYNGPYKSLEVVFNILLADGIVNVDSLSEAKKIVSHIHNHSIKTIRLGIRCNLSLDDRTSRFGMALNSDEFNSTVDFLSKNNIRINSIQCHTKGRSVDIWKKKSELMIKAYDSLKGFLTNDCIIDLGGGLPALVDKQSEQLLVKEYAEAVAGTFAEKFGEKGPIVFIEPGTALVAPCMSFYTSVEHKKTINENTYAVLNASVQNISMWGKNHFHFCVLPFRKEQSNTTTTLCGQTCLEDDIFGTTNEIIDENDIIIFKNIGAYSFVQKPPFIMPNVPIIEYDWNQKKAIVLRNKETLDSFCKKEEFDLANSLDFRND